MSLIFRNMVKEAVVTLPHLNQQSSNNPESIGISSALDTAGTDGWDVIQTISLDNFNQYLLQNEHKVAEFQFETEENGISFSMTGTFGQFSIVTGGDGQNLWLSFPIAKGEAIINGSHNHLTNAKVIVEVQLHFTPSLPTATSSSPSTHRLIINNQPESPELAAIGVIDLLIPESLGIGEILKDIVKESFQVWFNAHIDELQQTTFASVTLNGKPEEDLLQWLIPTYASYAYTDSTIAENHGILAIVTKTQNRTAKGLFHNLSPVAIPAGTQTSLLVNPALVTKESILPGMTNLFPQASAGDFELINNDTEIVSKQNTSFPLDPIVVGQGESQTTYYPNLTRFDLVFRETTVVLNTESKVNVEAGIDVFVDIRNTWHIILTTKDDGSKTLNYQAVGDPVITHRIHKSDGAIVVESLLPVILSLVGGIAGAVAEQLAEKVAILVLFSLLKAAVAASNATIGNVQEKGVEAALPSIDAMLKTATGFITWAGNSTTATFTPTKADLNGALQISGTLLE